jgi:hypothetical protein
MVEPGRREVRAFPGLHGIRNEYVPVSYAARWTFESGCPSLLCPQAWEMKHPGNAGPWVPKYPKGFAADGPMDAIAPGRARLAPPPVGQLLEFYLRRVRAPTRSGSET